MAGEELKLPISIPVETNAAEAAESVESLRTRIAGSADDIKAMAGSLKQLRGTSDEVKAAKAELTAKIEAERNAVSAATLALVKQGTTYDAQAQKEKKFLAQKKALAEELKKGAETKAKDRTDAMGAAIGKAGGPVASLKGKLDSLKSVMGESSGATGLMTLAAAGLVAAAAALVVGIVAAGVSLGKFILGAADAARSANLMREAWSGTGKNASNLGTQIEALSMKVPTSKAALNDLAISLMKAKISGRATVDAFNAIGQASAALGDEAGGKLQEFITRGRAFGKFRIDPREMLEGFGNLNFDDVAEALAKGMKTSVGAAKKALAEGRVSIDDGAKALADATEKRFGGINVRKMMSFENITKKLGERFDSLTSGVNLEPLLKPLSELGKLFDSSTVTGSTLKMLVTEFGKGMVDGLVKGIPLAKAFFQGLIIGGLKAYIVFLQVKNALLDAFGDSKSLKNIDGLAIALKAGQYAAIGIAGALVLVAGIMAAGLAPVVALVAGYLWLQKKGKEVGTSIREFFKGLDWAAVGKAIPDGIVSGFKLGAGALLDGVGDLAEATKKKFKTALGIASPSKVFAAYGENINEGVAQGVSKSGAAQDAVEGMVSTPGGSRVGGGGGAPIVLNVAINVGGGGGEAAAALSDASFLAKLTKAVEDALVGAGIPVQA